MMMARFSAQKSRRKQRRWWEARRSPGLRWRLKRNGTLGDALSTSERPVPTNIQQDVENQDRYSPVKPFVFVPQTMRGGNLRSFVFRESVISHTSIEKGEPSAAVVVVVVIVVVPIVLISSEEFQSGRNGLIGESGYVPPTGPQHLVQLQGWNNDWWIEIFTWATEKSPPLWGSKFLGGKASDWSRIQNPAFWLVQRPSAP